VAIEDAFPIVPPHKATDGPVMQHGDDGCAAGESLCCAVQRMATLLLLHGLTLQEGLAAQANSSTTSSSSNRNHSSSCGAKGRTSSRGDGIRQAQELLPLLLPLPLLLL